ncbi:hypothetical protein BDQ17DRAFT_1542486 [Cyathus striatus]|nr:hypothetical protein BDQ17DRAFT_1542486 [Cyathus striatus]
MSNLSLYNDDDPRAPHNMFNRLPSLEDADVLFHDFQKDVLLKLHHADAFRNHPQYAVTLVHRHTTLAPGEIMLSRGDVAKPEKIEGVTGTVYATAWLASGEPYEYTTDQVCQEPPHDLLKALNENIAHLPQFLGVDIIGIRYFHELPRPDEIFLEKNFGSVSILTRIPVRDTPDPSEAPATCWLVGDVLLEDGGRMLCACINTPSGHDNGCRQCSQVTNDVKSSLNKSTLITTTKSQIIKSKSEIKEPSKLEDGLPLKNLTVTRNTYSNKTETKVEATITDDKTATQTVTTTTTTQDTETTIMNILWSLSSGFSNRIAPDIRTTKSSKMKVVTTTTNNDGQTTSTTIESSL